MTGIFPWKILLLDSTMNMTQTQFVTDGVDTVKIWWRIPHCGLSPFHIQNIQEDASLTSKQVDIKFKLMKILFIFSPVL